MGGKEKTIDYLYFITTELADIVEDTLERIETQKCNSIGDERAVNSELQGLIASFEYSIRRAKGIIELLEKS